MFRATTAPTSYLLPMLRPVAVDRPAANDSRPLASFPDALEIRVAWALDTFAQIEGDRNADDLFDEATSGAYDMGFDAYPNVPMPEFFTAEPRLAASWQDGFAAARSVHQMPDDIL
ncbi:MULTISPECIES: hypothetical protein [unclassified Burkholderia]|uniref:hypothetical protein n=1 Tax=unclassified Burkholderia TaxID=2613784 RepID=UPI000755D86F|nr:MULTISPECIES: hypothetical protein [unclassified Burkholderia]KVN20727.1 hypothetical protein WT08_28500 [Burkholderia sp. MSMB1552]KWZ47009.1 hypothetical protein WS92_30200 [Burkholderia sp. MSMB1588]